MQMELLMIVSVGFVVGVMAPMTPNGQYSNKTSRVPRSWRRSSGLQCPVYSGRSGILDDFIFIAANGGFFDGHARHHLHIRLVQAGPADDVDPLLPL